jgi:hypothetical protein
MNTNTLIAFCRNVVILMTGNASYPTPSPKLGTVTTAVDLLDSLAQESMTGDRLKISARRDARKDLLSLMRQLASYVQGNCQDSVTILLSSGFEASRRPSPVSLPVAPANARLSSGNVSGSVVLRHQKSVNADNYTVQKATSPDGPFTDYGLSSSTRTVIDDLTPGTKIYVRARANGTMGASDWSNVACTMVI